MKELSVASWVTLYVLMGLLTIFFLLVWGWQVMVLKGKPMKNCDGSEDSWHEQKTHYGIALADTFLSCPVAIVSMVLIMLGSRWGFYLLALDSFFFLWANIMTTATSLRFEKPKLNFVWFVTFPLGSILGLAYLVWTVVHFDIIYLP